jgi:hypothetical protein
MSALTPLLRRLAVELGGAGERAVVGEADGRHVELARALRERRNAARPVEDRVLGVDVQMDEWRLGHERSTIALGQDRTCLPNPRKTRPKVNS